MQEIMRFIGKTNLKLFLLLFIMLFSSLHQSANAQEEISFSVVMPENYIEKKDLAKLDKSLNIPITTSFYTKTNDFDLSNYDENLDVIIARNYLIEEAIYEEKMAELEYSLIENIGYINPQFLKSNYDDGRKYSVPLTWGAVSYTHLRAHET